MLEKLGDASGLIVVDDKGGDFTIPKVDRELWVISDREDFLREKTAYSAAHKEYQTKRLEQAPFPTFGDMINAIKGWRRRGLITDPRVLGTFAKYWSEEKEEN